MTQMRRRPWIALTIVLTLVLCGCTTVRFDAPRVESHAIVDGDRTTAGRASAAGADRNPGLSGFQVLAEGRAAFLMRIALADIAERSLDLQYYSAGDDVTCDLLLQRFVAAAERGVRVRLLLDDMEPGTRAFAARAMSAHPGIQVRLFNPFTAGTSPLARLGEFLADGSRLNRRMHNKVWVTDNAIAVVGSRNLGDEYFDSHASFNFLDIDLLAAGPIVAELSRSFDAYWNSPAAIPMETIVGAPDAQTRARALEQVQARTARCQTRLPCQWLAAGALLQDMRTANLPLIWSRARLIADPPDREKVAAAGGIAHGAGGHHPGSDDTQAELLIASPYFVPDTDLREHLSEMRERGVRVAVLTNSLASTDAPAAHAGYARHRPTLLRDGVELHEVRPEPGARVRRHLSHRWSTPSRSSLHAKVIIQDRVRASVGSVNQDPRSRQLNTEACIVVDSPELAAELAALFDEATALDAAYRVERRPGEHGDALRWSTEEDGKTVHYDIEPLSSPWLRLWRSVLGAVIPERHL